VPVHGLAEGGVPEEPGPVDDSRSEAFDGAPFAAPDPTVQDKTV
jgi:hypothetical protein